MTDPKQEQAERFRTLTGLRVAPERALEEMMAEAEALYNQAPCGYHSLDDDGRIVQINDTELRWLGLDRDQVVGRLHFSDLLADDESRTRFDQNFPVLKQTGHIENVEVRLRRSAGPPLTALVSAAAVYDEAGRFLISRATLFDLTERKQAETALRRSNRALRVTRACTSAVIRARDETELLASVCRIGVNLGSYRMAWIGIPVPDPQRTVQPVAYCGIDDGYLEDVKVAWGRSVQGEGPTGVAIRTGMPQVNQNFLTNPRMAPWRDEALARGYQSSIALPLKDGASVIGALMLYAAEADAFDAEEVELLTELADDLAFGMVALRRGLLHRRAEERIEQLAYQDPLTRLPNRAGLMLALAEAAESARASRTSVALVTVNVSRFGEIQAGIGVRQADVLLCRVAERIQAATHAGEELSRTGNDEFAILIHGGDAEQARDCCRRIEQSLLEPIQHADIAMCIQVRSGAAVSPDGGIDPATLLLHSGLAARHARRTGADFSLYTGPTEAQSTRYLMITTGLRIAIEADQIVLHYQPVIDLPSGRVVGVEALVRWQHPQLGLLEPGHFTGIAEQTGLIQPLTRRVIELATRQAADWRRQGLEISVSVNVSASCLVDPDFAAHIEKSFNANGLPATALQIEITETALMAEPARARELLVRLHDRGIPASIDDFGTGYSSLSYVAFLPIQALKIDRSFVQHMLESPRMRGVIVATLSMARALNVSTIAEGVETREQAAALRDMGCTRIQGWLFSRAIEPGAVRAFVDSFALAAFDLSPTPPTAAGGADRDAPASA